jgi:hypothetical protein
VPIPRPRVSLSPVELVHVRISPIITLLNSPTHVLHPQYPRASQFALLCTLVPLTSIYESRPLLLLEHPTLNFNYTTAPLSMLFCVITIFLHPRTPQYHPCSRCRASLDPKLQFMILTQRYIFESPTFRHVYHRIVSTGYVLYFEFETWFSGC